MCHRCLTRLRCRHRLLLRFLLLNSKEFVIWLLMTMLPPAHSLPYFMDICNNIYCFVHSNSNMCVKKVVVFHFIRFHHIDENIEFHKHHRILYSHVLGSDVIYLQNHLQNSSMNMKAKKNLSYTDTRI